MENNWLTQDEIDKPAPALGDGAGHGKQWRVCFWLARWQKLGIWLACGIFCFSAWLIVFNAVKLVWLWWR